MDSGKRHDTTDTADFGTRQLLQTCYRFASEKLRGNWYNGFWILAFSELGCPGWARTRWGITSQPSPPHLFGLLSPSLSLSPFSFITPPLFPFPSSFLLPYPFFLVPFPGASPLDQLKGPPAGPGGARSTNGFCYIMS